MKRILVLDAKGKRICVPERLFNSYSDIEEWMDANYPGCIYVSDFEWNRDKDWNKLKA